MRTPLHEILGGVEARIAAAEASETVILEEAKQELRDYQAKIIAGEDSTGDPLHDGVLALYGDELIDSPEISSNYEKVAAQLKSVHYLEPVVIINRWADAMRRSDSMWLRPTASQGMQVGLIMGSELEFDYDKKEARLPTSIYVQHSDLHYGDPTKAEVQKGSLTVDGNSFLHRGVSLGSYLGLKMPFDLDSRFAEPEESYVVLDILIGLEQIAEWLSQEDSQQSRGYELKKMRELSNRLGIAPIEPATDRQREYLVNPH